MEVIIELVVTLVLAIAQLALAVAALIASAIALGLELILVALIDGIPAAKRLYDKRQTQRLDRLSEDKALRDHDGSAPDHMESDATTTVTMNQSLILGSMSIAVVLICVVASIVWNNQRKQRIAATHTQVNRLADTFSSQLESDDVPPPVSGSLPDNDAWRQPIELVVDKALLGTLLVVRSPGPDRVSKTLDDIFAIRLVPAKAKDVGGELVKRSTDVLKKRVNRLLRRDDEQPTDEQPTDDETVATDSDEP